MLPITANSAMIKYVNWAFSPVSVPAKLLLCHVRYNESFFWTSKEVYEASHSAGRAIIIASSAVHGV